MSNGKNKSGRSRRTKRSGSFSGSAHRTNADSARSARTRSLSLSSPPVSSPGSTGLVRSGDTSLLPGTRGSATSPVQSRVILPLERVRHRLPPRVFRQLKEGSLEATDLRAGSFEGLRVNRGKRFDLVFQLGKGKAEAGPANARIDPLPDLSRGPLPDAIYLDTDNRALAESFFRQLLEAQPRDVLARNLLPGFSADQIEMINPGTFSYRLADSPAVPSRRRPPRRRSVRDIQFDDEATGSTRKVEQLLGRHRLAVTDIPLLTVEEFSGLTKRPLLKSGTARSDEYQAVTAALAGFHHVRDQFRESLEQVRTQMEAAGREREQVLQQLKATVTDIKNVEAEIRDYEEGAMAALQESRGKALEFFEASSEKNRLFRARVDRVGELKRERSRLSGELDKLQTRINQHMKAEDSIQRVTEQRLAKGKVQLQEAVQAYRQEKEGKKQEAGNELARQLQHYSPATDLLQMREQAWGIPQQQRLRTPPRALDSASASTVYMVETNGPIGGGDNRIGFAKRSLRAGLDRGNDATEALGFQEDLTPDDRQALTESPRLVARQVASSRLDEALQIDVTAPEIFSVDVDGVTLGVTGLADGAPVMTGDNIEGRNYLALDLIHNGRLQRKLSDLQLLDAITGQKDRHLGNVFVNARTGEITGIDNDMAFPASNDFHLDNPGQNELRQQFSREGGVLTYHQDVISRETGDKILSLTAAKLRQLLRPRPGDPEGLTDQEINAAVERLEAVQRRIKELADRGQLVENRKWGPATYDKQITADRRRHDEQQLRESEFTSYLSRIALEPLAYDNSTIRRV